MTWRPTDCHAHSTHSDGALSVAEVVARGGALGVRPSVSDHISRDAPTDGGLASTRVERYLDDLEQYDVLRGGEFCWHDALWRELPPATSCAASRIASARCTPCASPTAAAVAPSSRRCPRDSRLRQYMEAHVASLEALARRCRWTSSRIRRSLPPPLREPDPHDLWSEELEERVVAALKAAGIAFEISARYPPHERIVRAPSAAGVRLSLGSDGHSPRAGRATSPRRSRSRARSACRTTELYDPAPTRITHRRVRRMTRYHARWICPVAAAPIRDGTLVEQRRTHHLRRRRAADAPDGDDDVDLGDVILDARPREHALPPRAHRDARLPRRARLP